MPSHPSLAACNRGGYKPPKQKLVEKRRVEENKPTWQ